MGYEHLLKHYTVGIIGAGGLGSNCAVSLVRAGIGKLVMADFDTVSRENLNRQFFFPDQVGMKKIRALKENLLRINPDLQLDMHDLKVSESNLIRIFSGCPVIVEAVDCAREKAMIAETVLSELADVFLVSASGLAGYGSNESLKTRRVDKFFLCGDETVEVSDENPPMAPRVGIVANMQANLVVEIILDMLETKK